MRAAFIGRPPRPIWRPSDPTVHIGPTRRHTDPDRVRRVDVHSARLPPQTDFDRRTSRRSCKSGQHAQRDPSLIFANDWRCARGRSARDGDDQSQAHVCGGKLKAGLTRARSCAPACACREGTVGRCCLSTGGAQLLVFITCAAHGELLSRLEISGTR